MDFRENIKRDFGIDLNIGDGHATSDNPLEILDRSHDEAVITQLHFIRIIALANRQMWRLAAREWVNIDGSQIMKMTIETVEVTQTQIERTRIGYYFKVHYLDILALPSIIHPSTASIYLPSTLEWLHFDKAAQNPDGLGVSYSYSNLISKAGIYVYDLNRTDIPDGVSEIVRSHFQDEITHVKQLNPEYDLWGSSAEHSASLSQAFHSDTSVTFLMMSAVKGHFLKFRLTMDYIPELDNEVRSILIGFDALVRHNQSA